MTFDEESALVMHKAFMERVHGHGSVSDAEAHGAWDRLPQIKRDDYVVAARLVRERVEAAPTSRANGE